jgi:hypothetical protein
MSPDAFYFALKLFFARHLARHLSQSFTFKHPTKTLVKVQFVRVQLLQQLRVI